MSSGGVDQTVSSFRESVAKLRSVPPSEAVRLGYRKLIYRKVSLERYEIPAGESRAPSYPLIHRVEIVDPDQYETIVEASPYLTIDDITRFRQQGSTCIAVMDGDRVAASTWMAKGQVLASDLQRDVTVAQDEHLSCRSYVDPTYRGQSLMSHMIHHYSQQVCPTDTIWGLIFGWNAASVRSVERLGWRHTGTYWTTYVFGRQYPGYVIFDGTDTNKPARPS